MEYTAVFYTHSGAIKYDKFLREQSVKCQLMPVPRALSTSCGIGIRFTYEGDISLIVSSDIEKIFKATASGYELIYENE